MKTEYFIELSLICPFYFIYLEVIIFFPRVLKVQREENDAFNCEFQRLALNEGLGGGFFVQLIVEVFYPSE